MLGAYVWWEHSVTYQFDGIGCVRAREAPKVGKDEALDVAIPQCKPGKVACKIEEFFVKNQQAFTAVAAAVDKMGENAPDELKNARDIIRRVADHPDRLCDSSLCQKMGDVLIAIDGLAMDTFAANDDKDWWPLAQIFEKEYLNPVKKAK